ncbi:DUF6980 family protein [Methylobacterium sp. E-005]|uniref:DUF6980 family protein n=1 Tax=Methylobacterium sp. E-005 TaxID=2836549 RepID=UPI00391C6FF9
MNTPCCERMATDIHHRCSVHSERSDCPDAFIAEVRGGYGLMVHDGGSSVVEIAFCPLCGSKLPEIGEPDHFLSEDEEGD